MKKIIPLALIGATNIAMAMYAEQAYLYKDPRIMGMGGANVAVGGYSSSLFHNPAGLNSIEKKENFVIDFLNIGAVVSTNGQDFANDISDARDIDDDNDNNIETTKVLEKYSGEHFNVSANSYLSISKNTNKGAFTFGVLGGADVNIMAHGNGGANGGFLEVTSKAYTGFVVGYSKDFETRIGKVDIGVGLKYINLTSVEGALGINELIEKKNENLGDILEDRYKKESSGVGIDLGAIVHPFEDNSWNPAFGLSILNIGSMDMDEYYGKQPMTVNIGASVTKRFEKIEKLTMAIDYVDLFNANQLRLYNYDSSNETISFEDYDVSGSINNLRLGVGAEISNRKYFGLSLYSGLYQGAMSAGVDLRVAILRMNFTTYEENIGTSDTEIKDRRYMMQLGLSW